MIQKAPDCKNLLFSNFGYVCTLTNDVECLLNLKVFSESFFGNKSLDLIKLHLVVFSHLSVFLLNVLICYSNVFDLSNLLKSKSELNLLCSGLLEVLLELLYSCVCKLR